MITKGYVTYAGSNTFKGKVLYSFRVGTEDKFFGTGTTAPGISKNDYVEFEYTENNGRYNVDVSSIKHITREESSPNSTQGSGAGRVQQNSLGREDYWANREARDVSKDEDYKANNLRIQYQSARNAAISVVDILVRDKLLKLGDGPKADNVSVVMGKIDDLTNEFFEKCGLVGVRDRDVPNTAGENKGDDWS